MVVGHRYRAVNEAQDGTSTTEWASEWRLIREECRPGPEQMALDEVAVETAAQHGLGTVRVYRWPDTLSLGYTQSGDTVDWTGCRENEIAVTRRQTGGGGIYHDEVGDISYSIAVPASGVPGDLHETYQQLCEPLVGALEAVGLDARFAETHKPPAYEPSCYLRSVNPAHDILLEGKKVSGNAQYRQQKAVLQHGSLSFDIDADRHLRGFETDVDAETFRSRVTGVANQTNISRNSMVSALEKSLQEWADATPGSWRDQEYDRMATLVSEQYGNDDWIRGRG